MSSEKVIAIVMDGKTYEVDKRKLTDNSDYFRALFGSGMQESRAESVRLQGLSNQGLELVLDFINNNTSRVQQIADETLEDLIETASFLQVTPILQRLLSEIRPENCVDLHRLSEVYGTHELRHACLRFMTCRYHTMLRRPEFHTLLPAALRDQVREMRMSGNATLLAVGEFTRVPRSSSVPWSMLRYGDAAMHWTPLVSRNLPGDMMNVRGYSSAVLDNYLFIVGGCRVASQEISAAHCYNPCTNEWTQVAPLNQKRSNFKLLAAQGRLFAVGGQSLGTVESYSPELDWWTCVSPMPEPLAEFSACECQGMIYVMGGYTQRDRNLDVLRYCPVADVWSVLRSSLPRHVRKQQMLCLEDTLLLVGGYTHSLRWAGLGARPVDSGGALSVQSYNVATGEWRRLKANGACWGLNLTCALHNDGLYVMSRDAGGGSAPCGAQLLKFDLFTEVWESAGRLPVLGQNTLLVSLYLPHGM